MSPKPTLILPVEIQVREWDAKLFVACLAAERGFRTILGCHARINQRLHSLPRAYYIAKGVTFLSLRMFRIANQLRHVLLAWDEEGLVYMRPEFYLRVKTWEPSIAQTRALFAWGEDNAELWHRIPATAGRTVHVTGNPRGDLLRSELRGLHAEPVKRIRERYGDFILFNSNFGVVNHFFPEISPLKRPSEARLSAEVPEAIRGTKADPHMAFYRYQLYERFQALLPKVARAFPDHRLVIRPHPSGNHQTWKRAMAERSMADGGGNIDVVNAGNVHAWILASKALLHNGCTSAVEAFLLGQPAVAYTPLGHELYDIPLPNALSRPANCEDEVIRKISELLDGNPAAPSGPQSTLARRHVAAMDGPFAAERILDVIEDMENRGELADQRSSGLEWLHGQLHCRWRGLEKKTNAFRRAHHNSRAYIRHRFPDLEVADVVDRVEHLGSALGRFDGVRVRPHGKNVFVIESS